MVDNGNGNQQNQQQQQNVVPGNNQNMDTSRLAQQNLANTKCHVEDRGC